jgi:PhnB protein
MKMHTYLNYAGNCEQALRFYEANLGGKIISMTKYADRPETAAMPGINPQAVLHARIIIGDALLMTSDGPPDRVEPMQSAYLSLSVDTNEEAERIHALLSDGGQIFMPMEETFFAHRFSMLRDKFGTSWMIIRERGM